MPSLDETSPVGESYLQRVLRQGATPFRYRCGARALLGMPAEGDNAVMAGPMPPSEFRYTLPQSPALTAAPELLAVQQWLDAALDEPDGDKESDGAHPQTRSRQLLSSAGAGARMVSTGHQRPETVPQPDRQAPIPGGQPQVSPPMDSIHLHAPEPLPSVPGRAEEPLSQAGVAGQPTVIIIPGITGQRPSPAAEVLVRQSSHPSANEAHEASPQVADSGYRPQPLAQAPPPERWPGEPARLPGSASPTLESTTRAADPIAVPGGPDNLERFPTKTIPETRLGLLPLPKGEATPARRPSARSSPEYGSETGATSVWQMLAAAPVVPAAAPGSNVQNRPSVVPTPMLSEENPARSGVTARASQSASTVEQIARLRHVVSELAAQLAAQQDFQQPATPLFVPPLQPVAHVEHPPSSPRMVQAFWERSYINRLYRWSRR